MSHEQNMKRREVMKNVRRKGANALWTLLNRQARPLHACDAGLNSATPQRRFLSCRHRRHCCAVGMLLLRTHLVTEKRGERYTQRKMNACFESSRSHAERAFRQCAECTSESLRPTAKPATLSRENGTTRCGRQHLRSLEKQPVAYAYTTETWACARTSAGRR